VIRILSKKKFKQILLIISWKLLFFWTPALLTLKRRNMKPTNKTCCKGSFIYGDYGEQAPVGYGIHEEVICYEQVFLRG